MEVLDSLYPRIVSLTGLQLRLGKFYFLKLCELNLCDYSAVNVMTFLCSIPSAEISLGVTRDWHSPLWVTEIANWIRWFPLQHVWFHNLEGKMDWETDEDRIGI